MFTKGKSGNPAGKPKGATNKRSRQTKEMIANICNGYLQGGLMKDLKMMTPKERATILVDLLPYFAPKVTQISVEASVKASGSVDIYSQLELMSKSGVAPSIAKSNVPIPIEENSEVQELIAERVEPEEVCNNSTFLEQEYDL